MMQAPDTVADNWDVMLGRERPRLVRLCAHLTGDAARAEDLAQETLLEAWRQRHRLRERAGQDQWLSAIARNVCRRWARSRSREMARHLQIRPEEGDPHHGPGGGPLAGCDIEIELERDELAALLEQALGLLPPKTRQVLLQKYLMNHSQAEIAARLGVSIGAVELRLHRGKLALRRLLATDLRQEAEAYGLLAAPGSEWQETRIWCPVCGQRRLVGRSFAHHGEFRLRCPGCFPAYHSAPALNIVQAASPESVGDVRGFKPALTRIMTAWDAYWRAHTAGQAPCPMCGYATVPRIGHIPSGPDWPATLTRRGVDWFCGRCGVIGDLHLLSLTLYGPIGRRFWREHPRIRMLPEREIDAAGRPALLTRFESLTDRAILEVVSARDTYEVLQIGDGSHV